MDYSNCCALKKYHKKSTNGQQQEGKKSSYLEWAQRARGGELIEGLEA